MTELLLPAPRRIITKRRIAAVVAVIFFVLLALAVHFSQSPAAATSSIIVSVERGESLDSVATKLHDNQIIRSPFLLRGIILLMGGERRVVYGLYSFDAPQNVLQVADRLMHGEYGIETIKFTVPEGTDRTTIADMCAQKLQLCSKRIFLEDTKDLEGYLFPDTYFFLPYATTTEVIDLLHNTYLQKIATIQDKIAAFGKTEKQVVTMASILEGEARQKETRQIVAGILWKRISIGMPLQVDTTFQYVNGKSSAELTLDDLKIDSPYNTYVNKGLTPTPISNPGLESILAAITPTKTPYIYFLTGTDGNMYYAKTLKEHAANKQKYLK